MSELNFQAWKQSSVGVGITNTAHLSENATLGLGDSSINRIFYLWRFHFGKIKNSIFYLILLNFKAAQHSCLKMDKEDGKETTIKGWRCNFQQDENPRDCVVVKSQSLESKSHKSSPSQVANSYQPSQSPKKFLPVWVKSLSPVSRSKIREQCGDFNIKTCTIYLRINQCLHASSKLKLQHVTNNKVCLKIIWKC